ncbi:MAG: aminotransferase class I/II-fold pyridoxal phosphate-dependent enzyme [Planctomycetota bacterium]|nr:MAG: aminotransferase class I/II-fold pyridoxal phosphate-dependent enzyme [Planctomycetota bacterium]
MSDHDGLRLPYLAWTHDPPGGAAPYCLAQSAMPAPAAEVLGGLEAADLVAPPGADALPRLEARLAELLGLARERVIVTVGASAAMHIAALRLFRPGTRVVVETPACEPLHALASHFGADLRPVARRLAQGWTIDPDEVRAALASASGPAHVFLSNPHDPSGTVLDAERVGAIAREAGRAGGVLLCNEAAMECAPTVQQRVHACRLAPNAISIGSLSQAYGLGALRIGWLALGAGLERERDHFVDMGRLAYREPATPALVAGRRALERLPALLAPLRRIEALSRPHLVRWLSETAGVEATVPPFGLVAFPRITGVRDTRALARHLAAEFAVGVVPGELFDGPGHLRVGCGVPEATLVEGLVRLGDGIRAFMERGG